MQPSEIRNRVLADHDGFRESLDQLERLARGVDSVGTKGEERGRLCALSDALLDRLLKHMQWEEVYLQPALREADAWGEERARRMDDDHREQREMIALLLQRLRDTERPAPLIVRDVLGLVDLLRQDMVEEERDMLDERVLRDDVVGIDVEAG